jgi:hypothetical protein
MDSRGPVSGTFLLEQTRPDPSIALFYKDLRFLAKWHHPCSSQAHEGGWQMKLYLTIGVLAAAMVFATPAAAQQRGDKGRQSIPTASVPPPGMCRIWVEGVPAAQQPAPTDCPTAIRNKPSNGRVIFGDDYVDAGKKKTSPAVPSTPRARALRGGKPKD